MKKIKMPISNNHLRTRTRRTISPPNVAVCTGNVVIKRIIQGQFKALGDSLVFLSSFDASDMQLAAFDFIILYVSGDVGYTLVECIRQRFSHIKIILITDDIPEIDTLKFCSLADSILKRTSVSNLYDVLLMISNGGVFYDSETANLVIRNIHSPTQLKATAGNALNSDSDLKLIQLICQGYSSSEIGKIMNKSHRTIEDHRERLYYRYNVKNKESLIALVVKLNLV